jgi:DNA-binding transcriptional LysR family regulator
MSLRKVNLNLLPILKALLDEASVARAAEKVGLSQPAVSAALARLREHFGDPLLVQSGRKMHLTDRALNLRPRVTTLCEELESLFAEEQFDPFQSRRQFVVASPDYIANGLARELAGLVSQIAPHVAITFVDVPSRLTEEMANRHVDLAVCGDFGLWPELQRRPVFQDRVVALVAPDHPMADRSELNTAAIEVYPKVGVDYSIDDTSKEQRNQVDRQLPIQLNRVAKIMTHSQFSSVVAALEPPFVAYAYGFLAGLMQSRLPLRAIPLSDVRATIPVSLFWHPLSDVAREQIWLRQTVLQALAAIRRQIGDCPHVVWEDSELTTPATDQKS